MDLVGVKIGASNRMCLYRAIRRTLHPLRAAVDERVHPMRRRNRIDDEKMRLLFALALTADANCIDVGANYGSVLELFLRYAPGGAHVAYEPLPEAAAFLRARFPGVEVREVAAADAAGTASFCHVVNDEGRSGLLRHHNYEKPPRIATITVSVETLDSLPRTYRPDVIKIDVEGAELKVIAGSMRLLREHQPLIVFEHYKGGSDAYSAEPRHVHQLLCNDAGMRIFDIDGAGPLSRAQMEERFYARSVWQFVAHR